MAVIPTATRVRVRFEPSGLELDVSEGERLLDVVAEHLSLGLPVACRAGNCGICRLRVRAGTAALELPTSLEQRALAELGAGRDERLGCQLRVRAVLTRGREPIVLELGPHASPPK